MGRFFSLDLRERVSRFVLLGASRRSAARHFGVSDSFAIKLMQVQSRSGLPAPKRQGRPRGSGRLVAFAGFLIAQVGAKPDLTMPEPAGRLLERHGVAAAPAVVSRLLCRHGFTYKKSASGLAMRTR